MSDYIDINNRAKLNIDSNSKPKKNNKVLTIRIVSLVISLLLLVGGCVSLYAYATINSIGYEHLGTQTPNPQQTGNVGGNAQSTATDKNNNSLLNSDYVLNIMLFGTDRYGDAGLSDTMILLSIDNVNQKLKMTSFLRDTYVEIPGVCSHKLNYAYAEGGAARSIQTIEANYGIKIDRYATVNFSTFKEIVDIMGGVELYVTQNEIDYINAQLVENGQTDHYLYATEGMVTLDGQQSLWYARNRGGTYNGQTFSGDDWDRTDRQRKFLEAVINNMKDASLTEIVQIVNSVGPSVTTDLKKTEIQSLVADSLTYLKYDVEQCAMPADGNWYYGYNDAGSVILVSDWNQARADLGTFIYEEDFVQN
ncbi:MAG: LCP family protein [Ruminococcus sp.]|nr:LCP family protein [Ruminococcus sp.]